MGDLSAEPSMEDILSSIKRIIAEEGDPAPIRARRPVRPVARPVDDEEDETGEVLELNDPMPRPQMAAEVQPTIRPEPRQPAPIARASESVAKPAPEPAPEPIVSQRAAAATRGSLETLSRLMVKPEPGNDGTLEGLVRELLRPMLREWVDANLPTMVEAIVEREIAKIIDAPR